MIRAWQSTQLSKVVSISDAQYLFDVVGDHQDHMACREIVDDLDAIDYTKFYSSVKKRGNNTGAENQQFAEFSVRAVKSAQVTEPSHRCRAHVHA